MISVLFHCEPSQEDVLIGDLWECGTAGITEEPGGLRAFFDDAAIAPDLQSRFRQLNPEVREEAAVDWNQISREGWDPILAGERFLIAPPWVDAPTPAGRMRLVIEPGTAFGTGRHESTQLVVAALEGQIHGGERVADIGCGSGILSVAAQMLGAGQLVSCDVDPIAVEAAKKRLDSPVFVGSADALKTASADVVVANITSAILEEIAPELRRVCRPGGTLILSGFLRDDPPHGFEARRVYDKNDWLAWVIWLA